MKRIQLKYRKGVVGEDLPAVIFTIILLMIFIISILNYYTDFFSKLDNMEAERSATSIAQKIFSDGFIEDPENEIAFVSDTSNVFVNITRFSDHGCSDNSWSVGTLKYEKSVAVSSLAILVYDSGKYCPGRIDVYVGR